VIVVRPFFSVSTRVLIASGPWPPHRSVVTSFSGGTTSTTSPDISKSSPWPEGLCQPWRQAAPARGSNSQIGIVHPSGPSSHCCRSAGVVHAFQTSSRGASKVRVNRTSRSVGVEKVVTPDSLVVTIVVLRGLQGVEEPVEAAEARVPEAAIPLGPFAHLAERRRLEPAGAPLRLPPAGDEPGPLQHLEVPGDGGGAHREGGRELLHRGLPPGQPGEDRAAGGVGQGGEGGA